jgi:surface polysaccharide O-acyltransferase-like enzyme
MEKKSYKSIDIAKFFFCSCIIALHTTAIIDICNEYIYWYIVRCIFRIAVPFFFVSSGFMIGLKINNDPLKINYYVKVYILRLFIPLLVFGFINTILEIIKMALRGMTYEGITFHVKRAILYYPYGALWYIQASIVAICLLYFFIKKNAINWALPIGILLYMFALVANTYYFLIEGTALEGIVDIYLNKYVSARNGLFVGFLFVGLGIWVSNNIIYLQRKKNIKYAGFCFIISYMTLIAEVSFTYSKNVTDDNSMFISFIVLIPSILVLLTCIKSNINNKNSILLRNLSTGMYFLHRAILSCIVIICMIIGQTISSLFTFIVVYILCLLICLISYKYEIKLLVKLLK